MKQKMTNEKARKDPDLIRGGIAGQTRRQKPAIPYIPNKHYMETRKGARGDPAPFLYLAQ